MATTPVKFSDIGKSVSDLLTKDIPVNSIKVEANTQTVSGVVREQRLWARCREGQPCLVLTALRARFAACGAEYAEVHPVGQPRQRDRCHLG